VALKLSVATAPHVHKRSAHDVWGGCRAGGDLPGTVGVGWGVVKFQLLLPLLALFVALRTLLLRIALIGLALTLLAPLALALTAFRFIRLLTHCVTSSLSRPTRRDSLATHVAIVDRSVLQTSCQRVPDAASPVARSPA